MKKKTKTEAVSTNRNLDINFSAWKANITSKRYSYFDFSREIVEKIAVKDNVEEVSDNDIRALVQALFPQYLQCSGLFDPFLLFDVEEGVRVDPPKYYYSNPVFVAGKRYWTSLLKLHPLLPSWTIIASPGHWEGPFHWSNRRLNSRELAAIQTFPDDYQFYGSQFSVHKQIGNAVPPLLAKKVVEELCKWI